MRFRTIAILAAAAIAVPLAAQQAQTPGKDASLVTAGSYAADANHTLIGWRVNHFGFNDYFGIFGSVTGTLTIDPANLQAAKVDVTIPISKVVTASEGLTKHLLKPAEAGKPADFFGAAPANARFVSKRVIVDGENADIIGDLTINGITREVTLDAEFTGAGPNPMSKKETIGFEGETTIRRSDFGINFAVPAVSDEVTLDISVAFEKQ